MQPCASAATRSSAASSNDGYARWNIASESRSVPASLKLQGEFVAGEAGREWRRQLPDIVAQLVERWSLAIDSPFPGLSYNYVAPVNRSDGTPAVLKVWFPDEPDFQAEAEALRLYDGDGAFRLLELDNELFAMLIERAEPGTDLWLLEDEDRQIEIAATMMRRLWRPAPPGCRLPLATAQWERMAASAPLLARDGFPLNRVAEARTIFETLAAAAPPTVLHEDLHQANILAAQREPWLAIDPHGVVGPPVLETIQMILNVLRRADSIEWPRTIARYVHALADATGLDREQVFACGVARNVLEAFWTLEDYGKGWERDIAVADAFAAATQSLS